MGRIIALRPGTWRRVGHPGWRPASTCLAHCPSKTMEHQLLLISRNAPSIISGSPPGAQSSATQKVLLGCVRPLFWTESTGSTGGGISGTVAVCSA